MALGDQIRVARERLGWTQAYLAERVGVTPSYVTKLEKDEALPRYDLLVALANVLVLDSERLLTLTERSRQERAGERLRTRGGMARETFGIGAAAADPATAARAASTAEQLGREILGDPDLQAAFSHLRAALADPALKPAVLKTLEIFAQQAEPARSGSGSSRGKKSTTRDKG